jgi:acetyltransferase
VPDIATNAEDAVKIAKDIGYPVVLKIHSPDITHKSDIGGVMLNIIDDAMVRYAYDKIMHNVQSKFPGAKIDGVSIQQMVREKDSLELILGTKKDPVFGTVMMAGMGGTGAELFKDKTLGFPPLNENLANQMIESLKIYPILKGYRGKPPLAIDKLLEILIRLSYLAADFPEISELDINPLLVTKNDCIALDARIIIDNNLRGKEVKPYSHLALRPYPEEYIKEIPMKDGKKVILRPIKPEDEFLWRALLASCSRETIYSRFRYFFHWDSHEAASRYCFIDYDREVAVVVESDDGNEKKFLGVGRLVADPDHETVEYAVLVSDKWQDKGLGSILTDYCFDIAKHWGMKRIVAQTTADNKRMISVFEKRGFEIEIDPLSSLVEVSKELK